MLLSLAGEHDGTLAADSAGSLELPLDGDVVVLELAYRDAGSRTPKTVVAVHADGSVVVPDADGAGDMHGRLAPTQLTSLLQEIVEEASVFELESDQIQQEVRDAADRSGRPWRVSDPALMLIRIRLRTREHEVRCPSVEIWHERFPGVESVARLCGVRRRLENVRAIVQVGGWDNAEELSELVNQELRRAFPEATPVTTSDLLMVRGRSPELRYVQFVTPPSTTGGQALMISVFEFPNQPARVRIVPLSGS